MLESSDVENGGFMETNDKKSKFYQVVLLVFFVLQLGTALALLLYFDMPITGGGFALASLLVVVAFVLARRGRLTMSVNLVVQVFSLLFVLLSILGKSRGEGTSLVFYIAPRFGILVSILLPFLVFGTQNKLKLVLTILFPALCFACFDFCHDLFGVSQGISFQLSDYPLVIAGSAVMLLLSISIIYFMQKTNEEYEAKIIEQQNSLSTSLVKISDSIQYAKRIQNSLLQGEGLLEGFSSDSFILFRPKETVSGDFYWVRRRGDKLYCLAADCTGHGVPGAFVSMLAFAFLNEVFNEPGLTAAMILEGLRDKFKRAFSHEEKQRQDGMDAALCVIDAQTKTLNFAGAHNPMFFVRDGVLTEFKATPNSIGVNPKERPFEDTFVDYLPGDIFFVSSDGFADQTDAFNRKKVTKRRMKELLLENPDASMAQMKVILEDFLDDWMGHNPQVDDILVMGIRL